MNYTKPDKEEYEDRPEDWLFCALSFSSALSFTIPEGMGIIVDVKGDMADIQPSTKRIIVYNSEKMIRIIDASERTDLKEGDWVHMIDSDTIVN